MIHNAKSFHDLICSHGATVCGVSATPCGQTGAGALPVLGGGELQVGAGADHQLHPQAQALQQGDVVGALKPDRIGVPEGLAPGGRRAIWGVWARKMASRGSVPSTRPSGVHPLQGVGGGFAQQRAVEAMPGPARASQMGPAGGKGRTPSWIITGAIGLSGRAAGPPRRSPAGSPRPPPPSRAGRRTSRGPPRAGPQAPPGRCRPGAGMPGARKARPWPGAGDAPPVPELLGHPAPHAQAPPPGRDHQEGRVQ